MDLSWPRLGSPISVQWKSLLCRWKKTVWSSNFYSTQCTVLYTVKLSCRTKTKKLYPAFPGWPTYACSYGEFSCRLGDCRQNKVKPHLDGLACFSYEYICIFVELLKEDDILPRRASPPNWTSSPPYEQPLRTKFVTFLVKLPIWLYSVFLLGCFIHSEVVS